MAFRLDVVPPASGAGFAPLVETTSVYESDRTNRGDKRVRELPSFLRKSSPGFEPGVHVLSHAFTADDFNFSTPARAGPDKVFCEIRSSGKDVVSQAFRSSPRSTSQRHGFDRANPVIAVQASSRKLRNNVEHPI
jgi:hypothetical protein